MAEYISKTTLLITAPAIFSNFQPRRTIRQRVWRILSLGKRILLAPMRAAKRP